MHFLLIDVICLYNYEMHTSKTENSNTLTQKKKYITAKLLYICFYARDAIMYFSDCIVHYSIFKMQLLEQV